MAGGLVKATVKTKLNNMRDTNSLYYAFADAAKKYPNSECYVCEGKAYTYKQVDISEPSSRDRAELDADLCVHSGTACGELR